MEKVSLGSGNPDIFSMVSSNTAQITKVKAMASHTRVRNLCLLEALEGGLGKNVSSAQL